MKKNVTVYTVTDRWRTPSKMDLSKNLFDGHVHIIPAELASATDTRFGIKRQEFGTIRTSSGYIMQLIPPYFESSTFSTDALIHTMDANGVTKAAIMQSLCFSMNEYVAQAIEKYPQRLIGSMVIEPDESAVQNVRYWVSRGLSIIKYEMSEGMGFSSRKGFPEMKFNDKLTLEVLSEAEKQNVTITIDPSRIGRIGYQVEEIHEVAERFKDLHIVICHLGVPTDSLASGSEEERRWEEMLSLAEKSNVWFDISAMPALFRNTDYPFEAAVEKVLYFSKKYGFNKTIWGTDIPGTFMNATYRQMIDMFRNSNLFTEDEKEMMFRRNAETAYRF